MHEGIVNKVAESGIVSLDLETIVPLYTVKSIDLSDHLWQGLALREADLRDWLKTNDFSGYQDCVLALYCSSDALIPTWAYMLVASKLTGIARAIYHGTPAETEAAYVATTIRSVDREPFKNARVVVKGCSTRTLPASAFIALTTHLQPVVKTLMFGEPCSTVPVYKQPRAKQG
jgi:hypothetical protein